MAEIVTQGIGIVERTADRARVDVNFSASGSNRNDAVRDLTSQISSIEQRLAREDLEVRSRQLSVHDNWEGQNRVGCTATQQYALRITDIAILDEVLALLVDAEPAWLSGPYWELADRSAAVREAQGLAVAQAKSRAEGYAASLDAQLGPLQRLTDGEAEGWQSNAISNRAYLGGGGASGAPAIDELNLEPSQIAVTVRCSIVWRLVLTADA